MADPIIMSSRTQEASPTPSRGRMVRDPYVIAGILMFLSIVLTCWVSYIETDEELYLLGSRRIADPAFLSADYTWSKLPPTSALFDHLVAPLWSFFDEFQIANLGRTLFWGLLAASLAFLARTAKLPAWSVVVGFLLWLLWGQNLGTCGAPVQGFQVKSFSYPLMFFALAFAIRGQVARAGMAAGLGAAFHIVVGGWACLAVFLSMLVNRTRFTLRQFGVYVLSAALFVVPVIVGVAVFRGTGVSAEAHAKIEEIYTMFAMPRCCDVFFFMSLIRLEWVRAAVLFTAAPILIWTWPDRRSARIVGAFVASLIGFFLAGMLARSMNLYGVLQLYPFQLANSLPALFLFIFVAAGFTVVKTASRASRAIWSLALAGTIWLGYDHQVPRELIETPERFVDQVQSLSVGWRIDHPMLLWIRDHTPRNSVFIAPFIPDFWARAERAQVASMRHPPLDQRLIGWKERLEAMNGFRPYTSRGMDNTEELKVHEAQLTIRDIVRIRERYGATHYVVSGERPDLAEHHLHTEGGYSVYDITRLTSP